MRKRLGNIAILVLAAIAATAAIFAILTSLGCPPILAAGLLAVLCGAFAAAWLTEAMYRKSFPNLFRKFDRRPEDL